MSRIFDALLRSEADRSGVDVATLTEATKVLERAERHAVSETGIPAGDGHVAENDGLEGGGPRLHSETLRNGPTGNTLLTSARREDEFSHVHALELPPGSAGWLVSLGDQDGPVAEAFRFLGVRLRHMRRDRMLKKVLITSTIPQEGKSLVSANLACTLSLRTPQRTLLLEGDFRRPSLTQLFGLQGRPGMCEWLREECDLASCMYQLANPRMWILPAGSSSGNYLELLQSGRVSRLMEEVEEAFDWVIVDSPPILPLADTSIWSRLVDGILLVTRQGKTEKRQLQKGLDAIESQKLIGAVLNSSSSPAHDYYYYTSQKANASST
jgi:capsular exopolysaccharide synthesis family protein